MAQSFTPAHPNTRNIALDVIKGICIILMIIGHSGAPVTLEKMISSFHMPAFFIVSGFLFKDTYLKDIRGFIRKRFKSIWWVYVFWTIVFILLHNSLATLGVYDNSYSTSEVFKRMGKGMAMLGTEQLLGGFWFLTALLFASLTSILYFKIFGLTLTTLIIGVLSSLAISWCMVSDILPEILYFNSHNFLSTSFFLTGILFAKSDLHLIASKTIVLLAALIAITISTFWIRGAIVNVNTFTLIPYYFTASVISLGLLVLFWKSPDAGILRYIAKIGSRTLDILIFHFIAFKAITFCRISFGGMDASYLSHFPVANFKEVMMDPKDLNWIIYTVGALFITICISMGKDSLNKAIAKKATHLPQIP